MSKKMDTQFLFTIIPFRLIREHSLLTSAERDMLIQIISFGKSGCFYSIETWRKITERGDHAIYRGLYKLQLLGIISIYKGNRKAYSKQSTSNLYRYKPDPAGWNLPTFIQDKLNADLKAMDREPIHFKDGFKSLNHFIHSFNTLHPTYAIKNIGDVNESKEIEPSSTNSEQVSEKPFKPKERPSVADFLKSIGITPIDDKKNEPQGS